jgi:hypothetical protein
MDCINNAKNERRCSCTYEGCSRRAVCCECIAYHRANNELPGCLFTRDEEKTYDRSVSHYVSRRR